MNNHTFQIDKIENELKDRAVAQIKDTQYLLVLFYLNREVFGNATVIVKKNNSEYYMRFATDRGATYIDCQEEKMVHENIKRDGWKYVIGWNRVETCLDEEHGLQVSYPSLLSALEKYTK